MTSNLPMREAPHRPAGGPGLGLGPEVRGGTTLQELQIPGLVGRAPPGVLLALAGWGATREPQAPQP
jgi:hypothetical protein